MKTWLSVMTCTALVVTTGLGASQPVGGGTTDGGLVGEYFANPDLAGEPAFTRREVRVRFDWGEKRPILGVRAESLRNFPRTHFSARWTGKIVPRFTEKYTFTAVSDEGARLFIKPDGAGQWTLLIDNWKAHPRTTDQADFALEADKTYDLKLEYRHHAGPAVVELGWTSPSTPAEIIEPLSAGSISGNTYPPRLWAGIRGGTWRITPEQVDENGWPTCDLKGWPMEGGYRSPNGRYRLAFTGKAEVEIKGAEFIVDGKKAGDKLPAGTGYDAAKNRTVAEFDFSKPDEGAIFISFSKTQRDAKAPGGSGFTDLEIMKPIFSGAEKAHEPGEVSIRGARTAFAPYASFRWQGLWNGGTWKQRSLPTSGGRAQDLDRGDPARGVPCFENIVLLANETGRDVLMGIGASLDYDALKKMAQLFRYGSDGVNPYDHEVENPVYPPLNPNLNLYLEHGNEMGWSAIQPRKWHEDLVEHQKNNSPEWQIVNFDGKMKETGGEATYRYHAYRTVKCSQIFREVFGDAAMGTRVRSLLFGQGGQQYEPTMLQFIDAYYNNGDGQAHVKDPHPVNYYLFGSGVAIYYGSKNVYGQVTPEWFADTSFEDSKVPAGGAVLRPADSPWKFSGKAGVCSMKVARQPAITGAKPAAIAAAAKDGWYGCKFTVGPKDLFVYQLGRQVAAGNKADHKVGLFSAEEWKNFDGPTHRVRETTATLKGVRAGEYAYGPIEMAGWPLNWESFRQGPVRLEAGKTYYLLSEESVKGDQVAGAETAIEAAPGLTIQAAVFSPDGSEFKELAAGGKSCGPVNMIFTAGPVATAEGPIGVPPDPNLPPNGRHQQEPMGVQSAFLFGKGTMSQEVDFKEDGDYAILFRAAGAQPKGNRFSVFIDDQCVWQDQGAGAFRKPAQVLYAYSTKVVPLKTGKHTVRFEGTGNTPEEGVYIDGVQVSSINEIMKSIPSKGQETSGKASDQWAHTCRKMSDFARLWGLVPCTYEGGWSLGGDWDAGGMNHWLYAKFECPQTVQAGFRSVSLYSKAGGWMFAYGTYDQFPVNKMDKAADYPLWQAMSALSRAWVFNPDNGVPLPAILTPAMDHYWNNPDELSRINGPTCWGYDKAKPGLGLKANGWKSWLVIVPQTGSYRVTANTTGEGQMRLAADEAALIGDGPAGKEVSGTIFLTKGQHAIKIKCTVGTVEVKQIEVQKAF